VQAFQWLISWQLFDFPTTSDRSLPIQSAAQQWPSRRSPPSPNAVGSLRRLGAQAALPPPLSRRLWHPLQRQYLAGRGADLNFRARSRPPAPPPSPAPTPSAPPLLRLRRPHRRLRPWAGRVFPLRIWWRLRARVRAPDECRASSSAKRKAPEPDIAAAAPQRQHGRRRGRGGASGRGCGSGVRR